VKEQLRSDVVNIKTNIKLYKSVIHPTLLYGGEYLVVIKTDDGKLRILKRKIMALLTFRIWI
jgi:hypothetical protein